MCGVHGQPVRVFRTSIVARYEGSCGNCITAHHAPRPRHQLVGHVPLLFPLRHSYQLIWRNQRGQLPHSAGACCGLSCTLVCWRRESADVRRAPLAKWTAHLARPLFKVGEHFPSLQGHTAPRGTVVDRMCWYRWIGGCFLAADFALHSLGRRL